MDIQVVGLAAAYIIFEIVKFLVIRLGPKPVMGLSSVEKVQLGKIEARTKIHSEHIAMIKKQTDDLHVWHDKQDEDGRPLWYVPRTFHESQEKVLEALRDISYTQKQTVSILERIVDKLEDSRGREK